MIYSPAWQKALKRKFFIGKMPENVQQIQHRLNLPSWCQFHFREPGSHGVLHECIGFTPRRVYVNVDEHLEEFFKKFRRSAWLVAHPTTVTHFSLWTERDAGTFLVSGDIGPHVMLSGDSIILQNRIPIQPS